MMTEGIWKISFDVYFFSDSLKNFIHVPGKLCGICFCDFLNEQHESCDNEPLLIRGMTICVWLVA